MCISSLLKMVYPPVLAGDATILSQIEGPVIGRIPHLFMRGFLWLRLIVFPHAAQTPQHLNIAQP